MEKKQNILKMVSGKTALTKERNFHLKLDSFLSFSM